MRNESDPVKEYVDPWLAQEMIRVLLNKLAELDGKK